MSTVRIDVLPFSYPAPQVSLPSKRFHLNKAKASVSSIALKSRSLPSPRSLPNPRLGLSRTGQRSRISRNQPLQASQWKSQIGTMRMLVTRNRLLSDAWRRYANRRASRSVHSNSSFDVATMDHGLHFTLLSSAVHRTIDRTNKEE
jgi:hypothetical protein